MAVRRNGQGGISPVARRMFTKGERGYALSRELGLKPWESTLEAVSRRDSEEWPELMAEAPHVWSRPVALWKELTNSARTPGQ